MGIVLCEVIDARWDKQAATEGTSVLVIKHKDESETRIALHKWHEPVLRLPEDSPKLRA